MLKDFNLLVTTARRNEIAACSETWYLLRETGDTAPEADTTGISGLIVAKSSTSSIETIEKLRILLRERPQEFQHVLRIIPINKVAKTNIDSIKEAVRQLSTQIEKGESFRITVEKRHCSMSTHTLIEASAAVIDRKVDLANPDKIVLIEIVGSLAGVSIIKPSDIMSTIKENPATHSQPSTLQGFTVT